MLTREEILIIYDSGPEAVISVVQRLETIIEEQSIRIAELEERVKVLESRLNQNSRNSSRPPSTDFFVKEKPNPKSLRKKSGKKPGGQDGHSGTTLEMVDDPE
ncbi:Mobile element protein [Methanosarcina mazei TMA]|uniref:Transposase n=1 Tax=Methanosarcina mazei TaxID=2209 RepID=A0A0F8NQF6_METMZ|nr:transposase [Methanosarcina mazei]UWJ23254.1 Mobile element protein [Methanosarcina mazei TMA]KKH52873.1 transposase [Methanosarcina mazei]KKH75970.1 transposase [Methanosarcina mazei]KKI02226.1 transposase [Methanosarcina mazei]